MNSGSALTVWTTPAWSERRYRCEKRLSSSFLSKVPVITTDTYGISPCHEGTSETRSPISYSSSSAASTGTTASSSSGPSGPLTGRLLGILLPGESVANSRRRGAKAK